MSIHFSDVLKSSVTDIYCFDSKIEEQLLQDLKGRHFTVVVVDLQDLKTEEDIFFSIVKNLPSSPMYVGMHKDINLTALRDSLWGEFWNIGSFSLVLKNSQILVAQHLNLMFGLHAVFCSVDNLRKKKGYTGRIKTFLLGDGMPFN